MTLPNFSTQLPGAHQVVEIGLTDVQWSYDADPYVNPARFFGNKKAYQSKVNPMPCYGHDVGLVTSALEDCYEIAPLCAPVSVNVLTVIDARNTNGWAQQQWEYYDCLTPDDCQCDIMKEEEDGTKIKLRSRNWDGIIVLSGRTTEIHPAIARYVVPHEYGHIVEDALGIIRYDGDKTDHGRALLREWAKVRKIPVEQFDLSYGPTTHHLMPSEIFANDFRYHVMCAECEWWPHWDVVPPIGVTGHKRETTKAASWWAEAIAELQQCYKEVKNG